MLKAFLCHDLIMVYRTVDKSVRLDAYLHSDVSSGHIAIKPTAFGAYKHQTGTKMPFLHSPIEVLAPESCDVLDSAIFITHN